MAVYPLVLGMDQALREPPTLGISGAAAAELKVAPRQARRPARAHEEHAALLDRAEVEQLGARAVAARAFRLVDQCGGGEPLDLESRWLNL
jgi:hypothetical protein